MPFALLALGAAGLVAAQASETPKITAECVDTLVFFARGNDAPYHDSRTTPFIDATCAKVRAEGKTCDYMDIQFSVLLGGPYCDQVTEGTTNGISEITAYQKQCPCSHIILGGYSEGANVMGNVLAGGACADDVSGIDPTSAAGKAIAAAVIWGNPRHNANQIYNVGTGSALQGEPRDADSLPRLQAYASKFRDYCQSGDPICAGGDNITQHLDYFDIFTEEAANWVVGKVDAAAPLCSASSSAASSSATAAAVSSSTVSIASASTDKTSSVFSIPSPIATSAIVTPSGANSTIPIPIASISTQYAVSVSVSVPSVSSVPSVNTSCASTPLYANSTVATIATPSTISVSQGYAVYPTTIKTVVSVSSPLANGGYSVGGPMTILTVITSTKTQQSTVHAVPSTESQGYAPQPSVASAPQPSAPKGPAAPGGYAIPSAPAAPQPAAPKGSDVPQPAAPQGYATPSAPAAQGYTPSTPAGPKDASVPDHPAAEGYSTPQAPQAPQVSAPAALSGSYQGAGESQCAVVTKTVYI